MSVVAFLYEEYYLNSCKKSFRGQYDDIDDAKQFLRGSRADIYLETMDLETFEWSRWHWEPDYEEKDIKPEHIEKYKDKYDALAKSCPSHLPTSILIERYPYPREADVEFFNDYYLETNVNYQARMKYLAGHWNCV
jgi:hypothetical protein